MAKKILKFDIESSFDFILIAIICSFKDYRLCFELNNRFNLMLEKQNDFQLPAQKNGTVHCFSFFKSSGEDEIEYFILGNKGNTGYLIPEKSGLDYFLLIKNASSDFDLPDFLKQMRTIEIINGAVELEPAQLKSAQNLIVD